MVVIFLKFFVQYFVLGQNKGEMPRSSMTIVY